MGLLWGDDSLVEGNMYYIFNGICSILILNNEEKHWLENVWNKYSTNKSAYLNLDTQYEIGKNNVFLTNDYCPICLKQKGKFEIHHCIPASEGGSDDNVNLLRICNSCHSIITRGCVEDIIPRYLTAFYHQLYLFGIDFYKMNPFNNKRYDNIDAGLFEHRPYIKEILDFYERTNNKEDFNSKLKESGLYHYKLYRSAVLGFIKEDLSKIA